jgi:site-specific recombinase XerD
MAPASVRQHHVRDGLMLPLLCVTLFRLKNFASLRLDRHLIRHGAAVKLEIPPEEVRNGKRFERVIPPEVVALLDRYLEHHRPRLLLGRRSPALWITEYGTDASPGVVPIAFAKRPSVSWACGSRRTGSAIAPPPVSPRPGPNSRP